MNYINKYDIGYILYNIQKYLREQYNIHIIIETDYHGKYSYKCCSSSKEEFDIECNRISLENNEIYKYSSYEQALFFAIYDILLKYNINKNE